MRILSETISIVKEASKIMFINTKNSAALEMCERAAGTESNFHRLKEIVYETGPEELY